MAGGHMAHIDLFELVGPKSKRLKKKSFDNMNADPGDADQCRELLRRLAKDHGLDPYKAELYVWEGRKKEYFRL